jgi:hypothetical protein
MRTPEDRALLRSSLLDFAGRDDRITGAAVTGSAAGSREDRWSDVDLALGVARAADLAEVLSDWTEYMYVHHGALHHVDVLFGAWTYRVFLLPDTLQVDLAFVTDTDFCALGPDFQLIFGKANEPRHPPAQPGGIVGMAWLYAVHARSCIARGRLWQAEYMISGIRDSALALACLRHNLSSAHGRGFDLLPTDVAAEFEESLVRQLSAVELSRCFEAIVGRLLHEIRCIDEELERRLHPALTQLIQSP